MESPAFFVLLFLHLTSLILAFGAVMVTDYFGLRWVRHQVPFERVVKAAGTTGRLVWVGWVSLVATGIPLLVLKGEVDRLMVIKLCCVALAGANGLALHWILRTVKRFEDADSVPSLLVFRLGVSLLLSQLAWWGAFVIGFLHRHVWSIIEWPPGPFLWVLLFGVVALALWAAGEARLRKRPSRVKVESTEEAGRVVRGPGPTLDPLGREP